LGISAGARLTVRRRVGNSKPALRVAARTRSRASRMARSVRPTIVKLGSPFATKGLPTESACCSPNRDHDLLGRKGVGDACGPIPLPPSACVAGPLQPGGLSRR
jgi:hypothetical protein